MNTNEHKFGDSLPAQSEFLLYQTEDGQSRIEVRLENETVWLSQVRMCALFDKNKRTISEHIRNIFREGELQEEQVVRKFRTTAGQIKQLGKAKNSEGRKNG